MAGRDNRRGCGADSDWGSPPPPRGMYYYEVMVQSGSGPCPAARSNHAQTDHVGVRGTLPRRYPYPEENIPTSVMPDHIDDSVPT